MIITENKEQPASYYDAIYANDYSTAAYQELYKFVMGMILKIENPSVLEIGCGLGDIGKMIHDASIPYRGFDFSTVGIEKCKQLCPETNFFVGDAYNIENYQPEDYNVVIALEVLEHLDDMQIIRMLPPKTHFIGSIPNHDDNASHLRLCQDPEKDIKERFSRYMDVVEMYGLGGSKDPSMMLYLFHGIIK
ncbi:MAG: class I SAM-dependent methyltransferase [Calditrichaeota bacterium]|nr:MAG: class I SAM-dependent methyltransferase [Calditrichota bacterium]